MEREKGGKKERIREGETREKGTEEKGESKINFQPRVSSELWSARVALEAREARHHSPFRHWIEGRASQGRGKRKRKGRRKGCLVRETICMRYILA